MNRRAFLKLFVGTVAVATIPIPKFLLPESKYPPLFIDDGTGFLGYGADAGFGATTLTVEMIEEAAKRSAMNMGQPDFIMMSKRDYKKLAKGFGYKVVYSGDEIITWPLQS